MFKKLFQNRLREDLEKVILCLIIEISTNMSVEKLVKNMVRIHLRVMWKIVLWRFWKIMWKTITYSEKNHWQFVNVWKIVLWKSCEKSCEKICAKFCGTFCSEYSKQFCEKMWKTVANYTKNRWKLTENFVKRSGKDSALIILNNFVINSVKMSEKLSEVVLRKFCSIL